jgi:hypothetical protein
MIVPEAAVEMDGWNGTSHGCMSAGGRCDVLNPYIEHSDHNVGVGLSSAVKHPARGRVIRALPPTVAFAVVVVLALSVPEPWSGARASWRLCW